MITFEEAQLMLDEIADALPPEIFKGLNGGYALTPELKLDKNGLYILGHYHVQPNGLGRYITIYYGSIQTVYPHLTQRSLHNKLKEVLHHELTHHLESQAGDRSLEIKDEINVASLLSK